MIGRIVIVEHPAVFLPWAEWRTRSLKQRTMAALYGPLTVCPAGTKSLWIIPVASKKAMNMLFTRDMLMRAFFGSGDAEVSHSELCLFDSGSYSMTQVTSPVTTLSKKSGSVCKHSSVSCETVRHRSVHLRAPWGQGLRNYSHH